MMSIVSLVAIVAITLVVVAVLNGPAFWKLFGAGRAQIGKAARNVSDLDAVANLEQAIDDSQRDLKNARDGLVEIGANRSRLLNQIEDDQKEITKLESYIKRNIARGEESSDQTVEYARQLKRIRGEKESNESQLDSVAKMYENTLERIKNSEGKIRSARDRAANLKASVRSAKAMAALNDVMSSFSSSPMNSVMNNLQGYEDEVQEQLRRHEAKMQVNADLGDEQFEKESNDDDARDIIASLKGSN